MEKEKQSPVEILYANSIKQREKEKREQEEKNKLLGLLGDRLTPAQKLYSTVDELRQKLGAIGDLKEIIMILKKQIQNFLTSIFMQKQIVKQHKEDKLVQI